MTPKNLGIVFEPNILRKKSGASDNKLAELALSGSHGQMVEALISHFSQIFAQ